MEANLESSKEQRIIVLMLFWQRRERFYTESILHHPRCSSGGSEHVLGRHADVAEWVSLDVRMLAIPLRQEALAQANLQTHYSRISGKSTFQALGWSRVFCPLRMG
jgi:hypothetical protein